MAHRFYSFRSSLLKNRFVGVTAISSSILLFNWNNYRSKYIANSQQQNIENIYRREEIVKHKTVQSRVWVTYKDGVYDITDFIKNHPGGADKIILPAGGSIEPYWRLYQQHYNSKLPMEILESLRIGTLHPDDVKADAAKPVDDTDPYRNDPELSPVLIVHQRKPINAEPPDNLLTDSWITPADLWFKRNHHPIPHVTEEDYRLEVTVPASYTTEGAALSKSYTLAELKSKFRPHSIVASIQCGGNRRAEMNAVAGHPATLGSAWGSAAIGTAEWTGVRLVDLMADAGADPALLQSTLDKRDLHVELRSLDELQASVPASTALDRSRDVMLAYSMNGQPLRPEHGYPLRAIVPGHVGVRNVKWLSHLLLGEEEAIGPWQRGLAYKGFGPNVHSTEGIDVEKLASLQEMPVTSMITYPAPGQHMTSGPQTIKGFAYSGGGHGIVRVDVSPDGGKTWKTAELTDGKDQPLRRAWAWTFWEVDVDLPADQQSAELVCKAVDSSYNVQPDTVDGIWNLRGILNNAWHRKSIVIEEEKDEDDE